MSGVQASPGALSASRIPQASDEQCWLEEAKGSLCCSSSSSSSGSFPPPAGTPRQCVEPTTLDGRDTGGPGTKHDLWQLISAKKRGSKWFKHRTATHNMALFLSFVRLDSSYGKVRRGGGFNICLSLALPLSLHSSYRKGQKGFPSVTRSRHLMAR